MNFYIGIIGAIILVFGSAYPDKQVSHPVKSPKNWTFAIGSLFMLAYSVLNYLDGGSIFFVILQIFINSSSVFMLAGTSDKIDVPLMVTLGTLLVVWSLYMMEDYTTAIFVVGLGTLGAGFVLEINTCRRNIFLTLGSAIIALFSFILGDWVFFFLNLFFAIFSGFYAKKTCFVRKRRRN